MSFQNLLSQIIKNEQEDEIHFIFQQIAPYGNMYNCLQPEHLDLAVQKEMIWVVEIMVTLFGVYSENAFEYACQNDNVHLANILFENEIVPSDAYSIDLMALYCIENENFDFLLFLLKKCAIEKQKNDNDKTIFSLEEETLEKIWIALQKIIENENQNEQKNDFESIFQVLDYCKKN